MTYEMFVILMREYIARLEHWTNESFDAISKEHLEVCSNNMFEANFAITILKTQYPLFVAKFEEGYMCENGFVEF